MEGAHSWQRLQVAGDCAGVAPCQRAGESVGQAEGLEVVEGAVHQGQEVGQSSVGVGCDARAHQQVGRERSQGHHVVGCDNSGGVVEGLVFGEKVERRAAEGVHKPLKLRHQDGVAFERDVEPGMLSRAAARLANACRRVARGDQCACVAGGVQDGAGESAAAMHDTYTGPPPTFASDLVAQRLDCVVGHSEEDDRGALKDVVAGFRDGCARPGPTPSCGWTGECVPRRLRCRLRVRGEGQRGRCLLCRRR